MKKTSGRMRKMLDFKIPIHRWQMAKGSILKEDLFHRDRLKRLSMMWINNNKAVTLVRLRDLHNQRKAIKLVTRADPQNPPAQTPPAPTPTPKTPKTTPQASSTSKKKNAKRPACAKSSTNGNPEEAASPSVFRKKPQKQNKNPKRCEWERNTR